MTVTINGTTGVAGVDGTASTPAIQGNDTNTGIFFPATDTIAFAEGGAEVARFDSNGNLGIGTTTPVAKLDVRGVLAIANSAASYWALDRNDSDGTLTFSDGTTERMRIDSSGNLLVGTTTNRGRLTTESPNDFWSYVSNQTGSGTFAHMRFMVAGTAVGAITSNTTTTTYATSSDYRLKENIAPMTGALATVQALKPVTYNWKVDGSSGQGFIAHELQAVVPDAVVGEKDAVDAEDNPQYQGIDTSFLVATLTAAIQEQQAIITDLKARIETLENK